MDEPSMWDRLTAEQQAWIQAERAATLQELGYVPLRTPPKPSLGSLPSLFVDESLDADLQQIRSMYSEAADQVRGISPGADLYELGLREVGESSFSAASRLAAAQALIQRGSTIIAHTQGSLRDLEDATHSLGTLDDEWRTYIAVEIPKRKRLYENLRAYEAGEAGARAPLGADGSQLTSFQAGTLAYAYEMDVIMLQQAVQVDDDTHLLNAVQGGLDDVARTLNSAGSYALGAIIYRLRRARTRALRIRRALITATSLALIWVGIHVEDFATHTLGQSLLVLLGAGLFMWAIDALTSWLGDRWIHRHQLAVLEEALTKTCIAPMTLRGQESTYNALRAATGWSAVHLLPQPLFDSPAGGAER